MFNSTTLGKYPQALDESVYKIMESYFTTGILDDKFNGSDAINTTNNEIKDQT